MKRFKVTHKPTGKSIELQAKDKDSALQIVCSESDFYGCPHNEVGWWYRKDCETEEIK